MHQLTATTNQRSHGDRTPMNHQLQIAYRARLLLIITGAIAATAAAAPPAPPKIGATLFVAHEALPRGGKSELAIEVTIENEWHLYHPLVLDAGGPTLFTFNVPKGARVKPVRYPTPEPATFDDLKYLAYSEKAVFLAPLELTEELPAEGELTLAVRVDAFACHDEKGCVPVSATAKLKLPAAAVGAAPKPAHEELFKKARANLPAALEKSEYIEGSRLALSKKPGPDGVVSIGVKEPVELIATIKVRKDHHIQDRDPGVEELIATRLWIEKFDGLEFEEQTWPKPHTREMEGFGKVREQNGEFEIRAPFTIIDEKFSRGPVALRVLLYYQCCTDAGQCFPPLMAEGVVRFVAATPNAPFDDPLGLQTIESPVGFGEWPKPAGSHATSDADAPKTASAGGDARTGGGDSAQLATAKAATDGKPVSQSATGLQTGGPQAATALAAGGATTDLGTLALQLLFAFLGGLILNIMPCVLPVLSIKVMSFVKQAGEDRGRVFRLGLAFSAGVLTWFWLFALMSTFAFIPLQHAWVVIVLTGIMFLMALNLFGVFEITLPGMAAGKLDEVAQQEGYAGSFFKGLVATLLGTACTAPFLVGALAFASTQPVVVRFLIFTMAAVGMAAPYQLLAANPKWLVFVPRPGAWMVTFKQAMGFLLVATTIYLLWVLKDQVDGTGLVWTCAFLGFLALAAWLMGQISPMWESGRRMTYWVASLAVVAFGWYFCFHLVYPLHAATSGESYGEYQSSGGSAVVFNFPGGAVGTNGAGGGAQGGTGANAGGASLASYADAAAAAAAGADWTQGIPWQKYQPGLAEELSRRGHTVYIDYTANWCVTCQANKKVALEIASTRAKMKAMRVVPIKADWTKPNESIRKDLNRYNQTNVPMNLIYPAKKPEGAIVLPITLLPGIVAEALDQAGASKG